MNTTELKKLAEAATPGPWITDDWASTDSDGAINVCGTSVMAPKSLCGVFTVALEGDGTNDVDYIAAANPAAILKLLAINAELVEALKGLDEAYCRAGPQLTRDERNIDRKRLIIARAALAKAEGGEL